MAGQGANLEAHRIRSTDVVTERWQEQRTRDRLLMRELHLRVRAERSGAPGQSGPPTDFFLGRKRRLLRRYPYFAVSYLLAKRWPR